MSKRTDISLTLPADVTLLIEQHKEASGLSFQKTIIELLRSAATSQDEETNHEQHSDSTKATSITD